MANLLQINLFCMKVSRFKLSLAMYKEIEKIDNKNDIKVCICGEKQNIDLWADYFKHNKPNIRVELVIFKNNYYPSKVQYIHQTNYEYICKLDDDVFMSYKVWNFIVNNLNTISDSTPLLLPIFTNGIPSADLFVSDFLDEKDSHHARNLFIEGRIDPNQWGLNYTQVNEYIKSLQEWDDKSYWNFVTNVNTEWDTRPVPWYYSIVRGVHPARFSYDYNMFIAKKILEHKDKFMQPNNLYVQTYKAPYVCNNLFFSKTSFYKEAYKLFDDGWDEGQLTLKMKLDKSQPLYVRNGFAIHMAYGMTQHQQLIEDFYINNIIQ